MACVLPSYQLVPTHEEPPSPPSSPSTSASLQGPFSLGPQAGPAPPTWIPCFLQDAGTPRLHLSVPAASREARACCSPEDRETVSCTRSPSSPPPRSWAPHADPKGNFLEKSNKYACPVTAIPVPGCTQRKGPGGYREVHRGNQRNSTCLGRTTERGPYTLGLFPPWEVTVVSMSHGNGGRIIPLMLKTEAWGHMAVQWRGPSRKGVDNGDKTRSGRRCLRG